MAKRLDIRLDDDLYGELVRHAESQDRSVNWIVGKAVQSYCAAATQAVGEYVASNPAEERARHDASLGRADRPEEMGVVDEARRHVTPSFKGGKR